ncbi:DNA-binding protein [Paraburkholderia gardini]|uniref:DNA-binding protein n=1 Tax=Paraburkholderia gardini TaxID=2823469 RepID=UPI001E1A0D2E|nr:DNA-binding protein [Paraburkholderia gardini]CAG4908626.1 hypothetical protein R69919_03608 [Paraburkholderia gardini]
MAYPRSESRKNIRSVALEMLTAPGETASISTARFRQLVSVRKVRDKLGGGDPAALARELNALEPELTESEGELDVNISGLAPAVTKIVSNTAVTSKTKGVRCLGENAEQNIPEADAATRTKLKKSEINELRRLVAERDSELSSILSKLAISDERSFMLEAALKDRDRQLAAAVSERDAIRRTYETKLLAEQMRFREQLLEEQIRFREQLLEEQIRSTKQLSEAQFRFREQLLEGQIDYMRKTADVSEFYQALYANSASK